MILFIFVLVLLDRMQKKRKKKKKQESDEEFRLFPEARLSSRLPIQVGCMGSY